MYIFSLNICVRFFFFSSELSDTCINGFLLLAVRDNGSLFLGDDDAIGLAYLKEAALLNGVVFE